MKTRTILAAAAATMLTASGAFALTETINGIEWNYVHINGEYGARICVANEFYVPAIPQSSSGSIVAPSSLGGYAVTSIGPYAFCGCNLITSVSIPSSVASIRSSAFLGCSRLQWVALQNGLISIGYAAFMDCASLEVLSLPSSVTTIEDNAFYGCSVLSSISIPQYVTSIGDNAFLGCNALRSIVVNDSNTVYDSRNGCNAVIRTSDDTLIIGCGNTIIPESVTSIGDKAFAYRTILATLTIPNSVTNIGSGAFGGCTNLTTLAIPDSVTSIGNGVFSNCTGLETLYLPSHFVGKTSSMGIPEGCQLVFSCQVPLDQAGGIGGTTSVTATNGVAMPTITLPTREGYAFGGYFTAANGGGTQYYTASGAAARNWDLSETATLYAKWTKNPDDASSCGTAAGTGQTLPAYTIAFNANAKGVKGKMSAQKIAYGKAAALRKNAFTRSGHVFIGWAKSKGGAVAYANGATVKNPAAAGKTLTLYAVWAKPTYKVAFYANGGKGKMGVETFSYGKAKALSANKFKAPKGKKFAGWATSKANAKKGKVAYKNKQKVKNLIVTGKTVKLYAVWKKK